MSRSHQLLSGIVTQNRVASSYVFYSADGTTALDGARLFGRLLFCDHHSACGQCGNCRKLFTDAFVDYREIMSEKAISIDTIRSIQHFVQFGPHHSPHLCVVIHNAHMMTSEAANAFLKSLEEPMPGVCFILITIHPSRLLKTILSRSQILDFPSTADSQQLPDNLITFSDYFGMTVSDRFQFNADLCKDTQRIFIQLAAWLKDIQDAIFKGNSSGLAPLKEIVEIISRLEYNLNHRLQLDALAVKINE